ncbi:hypothetical protein [Acidocella sp.]|uniref:hypothetical protein n=1 Tax=Acidocella sp. TaxID=50710 RepID=UPI003D036B47
MDNLLLSAPTIFSDYEYLSMTRTKSEPVYPQPVRPIRLDQAFRWVLAWFEDKDEVPVQQCLGLLPGQDEAMDLPPAPAATGPGYARRFKPAQMPSRRDGSFKSPVPIARTPRVPDFEQLTVLLHDREHGNGASSQAELRVCAVHDWLQRIIWTEGTATTAETSIERRNGAGSVRRGRTPIAAQTWMRMNISYADAEAECIDDDYEVPDDALLIGRPVYKEIELDQDQLYRALCAEFRSERPLDIHVTDMDGQKKCEVWWRGRVYSFDLGNRAERKERAMRSFEILIQNSGIDISYWLLDLLAGRDVDTGVQSPKARKLKIELAARIRPISQSLYGRQISIFDAHKQLDDVLSEEKYEGHNLWSWATWSPGYEKSNSHTGVSPTPAYKTVAENVQKSLQEGEKLIAERVSDEAAAYLRTRLRRGPISASFKPDTIP